VGEKYSLSYVFPPPPAGFSLLLVGFRVEESAADDPSLFLFFSFFFLAEPRARPPHRVASSCTLPWMALAVSELDQAMATTVSGPPGCSLFKDHKCDAWITISGHGAW
jgi:hypothetical protein